MKKEINVKYKEKTTKSVARRHNLRELYKRHSLKEWERKYTKPYLKTKHVLVHEGSVLTRYTDQKLF